MDEEWVVNQARSIYKTDRFQAKSWLIVGRTLFPRNVDIQFEIYQLEKSERNTRDAAKLFEELTLSFPHEVRLWTEISAMSEALQSDSDDSNMVFLRDLFNALPAGLQHSLLLSAADSVKDTLQQCKLLLLVVDRYPGQVTEQGMKLVDLLLQAEKVAKYTSPVNHYRKYLACDVLPLLMRSGVPVCSHQYFFVWLEKALEFYMCYIFRPSTSQDTSSKDNNVTDPWNQLFQLMQLVSSQLQWKFGRVLLDNSQNQFQLLNTLYESVCGSKAQSSDVVISQREQLFYLCLVCFLRSLSHYAASIEQHSPAASGNASSANVDRCRLVMVETCSPHNFSEPVLESKKMKVEPENPNILVSEGTTPDVATNFLAAFRFWKMLHHDLLKQDFLRLCQLWSNDCWIALQQFEVDACLYQGQYQDAITRLQTILRSSSSPSANTKAHVSFSVQLACCYCCVGLHVKAFPLIIEIVSSLNNINREPTNYPRGTAVGRQLHLMPCSDGDVFSYCIAMMIASLKEKAWKVNSEDVLIGHLIVLLQYDLRKYESLFCDIIRIIQKRGQFTYNLFLSYVIDIDILEEFAYICTPDGGRVSLDILPTSAKATAQARTVTRGVNRTAKEDVKMSLERQVLRSDENISHIIRTFLTEETDLLKLSFA